MVTTIEVALGAGRARLEVPEQWSVSEPVVAGTLVPERRVVRTDELVMVVDRVPQAATFSCGAATVTGHAVSRYRLDHGVEPTVTHVRVPGASSAQLTTLAYDDELVGRVRVVHVAASSDGDVVAVQAAVRDERTDLVEAVLAAAATLTLEEPA